ncbi:BspA family leucine-rich repeat surface protein [Pseudooceanicola marinus]|uniref:BspA family leucine-rich repeat surface protein n=1 Tax=Pseudooceanicola marinus TaxID=396013 RepID=UPI001CD54098|nr:BspA family leucine-rich repeat surface protein [Pseudooceanicola marinus]MCA1334645.1 BspA family leucine-rich repeat surface protein [Pseudooceanicola marinus]
MRGILIALALLFGLLTAPAQSQTTPEADSRCYAPANAGTVGEGDWTGCADMYIVPNLAELRAAAQDGSFAIDHGGVSYTFEDGASTVFTGQVTSFFQLFPRTSPGAMDLSHWDTSRVTSMEETFSNSNFSGDIGSWDVSNVTTMAYMFNRNDDFNRDISGWDVSNVTNMAGMFYNAVAFNQDIGGWDVASVTDMRFMFTGAGAFNQDIGTWNVARVTNMRSLFYAAYTFDQDIGAWNVASVTDMGSMFAVANAFNQDIGAWNVANVTNMYNMFNTAIAFNQDLSAWDVRQILSEPEYFDADTHAWTNPDWRPQWGTAGAVPTVTDVIALGEQQVYGVGDTIEIAVQFSADIQLTGSGTPTLTLGHADPGGATARAVFDRIEGSRMVLGYTVPEGLELETLEYAGADALVLNGAAVAGANGSPADTTMPQTGAVIRGPVLVAIDGTAPEAGFADVPDLFVAGTAFTVTLTSTETITDFDAAQITVTGGTLSSATDTDSQSRSLTITPDSEAEQITLALAPEVFTDLAGNAAVPPQDLVITADTTAPVFADVPEDIAVATEPGQDSAEVTWTPPTATDDLDGAITPLTASHQPGDRFDLGQTTVTYTATDSSGNAAQASFTVTVTDGEAPQITGLPEDITVPTDPGEITAVVTWDAPVATDNSGSVTLSADHAPGDTFALGDTLVTYTATDGAGLETQASFTVTVERRDYVAGETQVTSSPDRILANGTDQSEITVTLYDDVGYPLGYGGASVVLATTLGQLGPVSDRGDGRYTATLTSGIRSGEAEIAVTLDGEPVAEGLVTFEVDTAFVVAEVTERTRAFSQRRLTRTFASQPRGLGLDRRRSETPGLRYAAGMNARGGGFAGSLSFSGRDRQRPSGSFSLVDSSGAGLSGNTSFDASWIDAEGRWHGWAELAWSRHEAEAVSGSYGVLHLGVDRLVTEDLAIGLMLSLDRMEEDDGPNDRQEGTGWLAGPYLLAELREGLFVSSRLAWGRAEDSGRFDIYDSGFPWTGDRSTRRALATLALYGSTDWRALTLTPQVELLWGRERIGAFTVTDGFGTARVPEAEVWAARLALSTRVEWATEALNAPALAFVTPTLNWDTGSETSGTRPSAALELGLRSTGRGPWSGEISLAADGLGDDNLDAWTLRLSAARRF